MNALLQYNRAIVTDIAGTTRDTLNESFIYKGVKINLIDTAGIRESADKVESIGIERSWGAVNNADIVLYLIDNSKEINSDELNILNKIDKNKIIIVKNKSDIKINGTELFNEYNNIEISALTGQGIEELKELIYNKVFITPLSNTALYITNNRHKHLLEQANKSLNNALTTINNMLSLDLIVIDIQNAWNYIGEITGKSYSNEVLNTIFSKFCLGK